MRLTMITVIDKLSKYSAKCVCSRCKSEYLVKNIYDAKKSHVGDLCDNCKDIIINAKEINQDLLHKLFDYNSQTGILSHKLNTRRCKKNTTVGHLTANGYLTTSLGKKKYLVHRLIFMHKLGYFPEQIDHINHIKTDNSWDNLREVCNRENSINCSLSSNSTSKVNGVSYIKSLNKYRAYIYIQGKQKHLGVFDSLDLAKAKREEANEKYKFHQNHGN